ncbi:hypothetical protein GOODEAATRI_031663, partial [Goodea atripinnis]
PHSLALRAFHSTEEVDVDFRSLRLRGKLYRSSSDQSCDTVIQINLDGSAHSKAAPLLTQPEFVPIIPSLHPNKSDLDDPEFTALLQELLRIPQLHGEKKTEETVQGDSEGLGAEGKPPERDCLKCDTFAELQERLGCIDGSEVTMEVLKSSLKGATLKNILTKTLPQKETFKAPHTLLNVGKCCSQATVGEKQTDGSLPGDSFKREDSGLFDCEECSANSSSEELMNHALGLSMAYPCVLPTTRAVKSGNNVPSKCFEANSQSKAATNPSEYQLQEKQENHEAADWFKPDKRASPIGNSSPISPLSSCSSSHSMAKTVVIGDHKAKDSKEMKATITVTVQQPLDKMGQDELVFSMVEEVTISGAYDSATTGGNIICIRDPAQSQEHGQTAVSSQPIRIIGDHSHHFFHTENPLLQSAKHSHSKLSAVGKLKIATPKVRRQSAPSIKNLSHKALQQSSRSASLAADSKMVSFERTSSFFSSSPPPSYRSISRTPSQSSTCSSTKSAIQGFVNGRLTELLRERSSSPSSSGPDQMSPLRSPYSQMTAPRTPDNLSGHASDTTSVLSGDLPPAMGKTSLHFSNRSSLVSSGYDSLVRDSEAMGSATSNRDSVSNRSGSLLSVTRSSRSSRRRGNTGKTPLVKPE